VTDVEAAKADAWIVDASVAVKWFLPVDREPEGDLARRAVGQLAMRTTTLAFYEVGNVLARNSSWDGERVAKALALLLEVCGDPLALTAADHRVAGDLASDHGITFYDASYAAIAQRLGREVLSADGDLIEPGLAANLKTALD
jgi:predicted nucleic acid-binding protein